MKRKRALTLLEIMIVIFLIGLIGSVIGFNMKGSMEKGKAFKSKQAKAQLEDILTMMLVQQEVTVDEVKEDPALCLEKSGLVKSPKSLIKDGWNMPFTITINKNNEVTATSEKLKEYQSKHANEMQQ